MPCLEVNYIKEAQEFYTILAEEYFHGNTAVDYLRKVWHAREDDGDDLSVDVMGLRPPASMAASSDPTPHTQGCCLKSQSCGLPQGCIGRVEVLPPPPPGRPAYAQPLSP